ncbi:MEDS domain-containing protein [Alicyclobacillus suci]|uniref:MEDS domain-containing protein n=1 Tax=Alicyclobacillus suci TaxID=2816080 RepID=UPI002E2E0579|nr:MEDS domain-containing protein [Alicyclobacillus suci]
MLHRSFSSPYIDYCSTYVLDGVKYGYRICLITSDATYTKVHERVKPQLTKEQLELIHFVPSELVYQIDDEINDEVMMQRHLGFLRPIFKLGVPVRTWSEVTSSERKGNGVEVLINWEDKVQQEIGKLWLTSVCAYEGSQLSGPTMTALLRSHEYFLTDRELVCSPLYRNEESRCYV